MTDPDDTQERLLAAAGQVFAEKGYQAATIREIKDRAHANVAAVNYYFGDKERLYIETIKRAFCCRMDREPPPEFPADMPPADKLRLCIQTIIHRLVDEAGEPWAMQVVMRELTQPTEVG